MKLHSESPDAVNQDAMRHSESRPEHHEDSEENIARAFSEWKQLLQLVAGSLLGLFAAILVLSLLFSSIGEFTFAIVWNTVGKVLTPFIMEFSIAVGGILFVLIFNQWRRFQAGSEWVTLDERESRAQSIGPSSETSAAAASGLEDPAFSEVENLLRTGKPSEADALWVQIPKSLRSQEKWHLLEWRLSLMQANWPRAQELSRLLQSKRDQARLIAQEVAEWFQSSQHDAFSAKQCHRISPK